MIDGHFDQLYFFHKLVDQVNLISTEDGEFEVLEDALKITVYRYVKARNSKREGRPIPIIFGPNISYKSCVLMLTLHYKQCNFTNY